MTHQDWTYCNPSRALRCIAGCFALALAVCQTSAAGATVKSKGKVGKKVWAKPTQAPKGELNEARIEVQASSHSHHPGTQPTSTLTDITTSNSLKPSSGFQAMAASIPQPTYSGPDACVDATKTVCAWDDVHHVHRVKITVTQTQFPVQIETKNLQSWPGTSNIPDTLVFALRCDAADCSQGKIMGVDDDHGPDSTFASKLSFHPDQTGEYWLLVLSYDSGRMGTADVVYSWDNQSAVTDAAVYFGGYQVQNKEVRENDSIFVGKNTNDSTTKGLSGYPEYHDSMLFFLGTNTNDCDLGASCGDFYFNDDVYWGNDYTRLSRIEFPSGMAATNGRALVSVWNTGDCTSECGAQAPNPYKMNARLFHHRRHTSDQGAWSGATYEDADQDGLSAQIEAQIGTCDAVGDMPAAGMVVNGFTCRDYRKYVNDTSTAAGEACGPLETCWSPTDSDNDGIRDDMEVWAAAFDCSQTPVSPRNDAGVCTPIGLHDTGGCTGWCVSESISAVMDPNPAAYDLYVRNDYWICENSAAAGDPNRCANNHSINWPAGGYSHEIFDSGGASSSDQTSILTDVWTEAPGSCWDGTDPTGSCKDTQGNDLDPLTSDRRIYSQLHVWGVGHRLEDDAFGVEANYGGVSAVVPYYAQFHDDVWRHGRLGRYSLATHFVGGQAWIPGEVHIWGNSFPWWNNPNDRAISDFSHEFGHTLGLSHPHTEYPEGPSYCANSPCPESTSSCLPCTSSRHTNPVRASIMSYDYGVWGMRAKAATAPAYTYPANSSATGCSKAKLRFSKGAYIPMNEATVNEELGHSSNGTPPRWQQIISVQAYGCYDHPTDEPCWAVPSFDFKTADAGIRQTPYCTSTQCFVNWDKDSATPPNPNSATYTANLNSSRVTQMSQCRVDVLSDLDEWGYILSLGTKALKQNREWTRWWTIYADGFNAMTTSNYAAWPIPITTSASYATDVYPINACESTADCASLPGMGQTCKFDACTQNSDCAPSQTCDLTSNTCTCANAGDCRSGRCNVVGTLKLCETEWGGCSCTTASDCSMDGANQNSCVALGGDVVCKSFFDASVMSGNEQPAAAHLRFDGGGVMQLTSTGSTSPLETISDNDTFLVGMDFRFDGFVSSQTAQVLLASGSIMLELIDDIGTTRLRARVPGGPTLIFTPTSPWTLRRWYRVRVGYTQSGGAFYLVVSPWRLEAGAYTNLGSSSCVRSSATLGALPPTGHVVVGGEGSGATKRLRGAVDNLYVKNTIDTSVGNLVPALSTCTVQP